MLLIPVLSIASENARLRLRSAAQLRVLLRESEVWCSF
jgi:hypothetical protein